MTILKRMMVAMAALAGVMVLFAGNAFASTASQNALGFCGPGFTDKAQAVAYYAAHPGTAVEMYVRSESAYSHIQPDQSFASYLNNPHVKAFRAPAGYQLNSNTYCPTSNSVAPYSGKLAVGGVMLLWWCSDTRGYGCVPIAKGYCNNMVTGKQIRPVPPKVAKKPKKQIKVTVQKQPTPKCVTVAGVPLYSIPSGLQIVNGVCQTNSNTTTQTGTTSGQGSPVININQNTQVNVNQSQGQQQTQTNTSPPPVCSAPNTVVNGVCTAPAPKPAPSCYINMVQELDESNSPVAPNTTSTTPVYLHCTAPSGDSLSFTLHAGTGSLSTNSASQTGSGSDQVTTVTYTAPTEPGTDTVSVHVVDNT